MAADGNSKSRVVIAGGSGFLGKNLARALHAAGREVVVLSRTDPQLDGVEHAEWDGRSVGNGRSGGDWTRALDGAHAVVNLAGRSVDCVKRPDTYDEILRSRVESTRALGEAIRSIDAPPPVWVQMSTAHRYGDPPEVVCDEDSAFGYGMAPIVGEAWERAFDAAKLETQRCVVLRTSFVVGRTGGALPRLEKLVRFGLGGTVGHGRQGMSWIHEADMNRLFVRAIDDASMSGAYIATAPNPVSNAEFMRALRRAIGMRVGLPAFSWMVRIGAPLVMRTDPELGLYGRYCVSKRLRDEGFEFEHPAIEDALRSLYA